MKVEGEADDLSQLLFPHGLIPLILGLVVDTWNAFKRPTDEEIERRITDRFVKALQRESRRRGERFRVMSHVRDLENLDLETGKNYVEIDIYIPDGYDERCYFGIEAKKLNTTSPTGKWESQAGDYAGKDGMGCFVDGRYAVYQCEGAMVGYVMDGDCAGAKTSIAGSIEQRADALRVPVPCPLHPTKHLPDYPDAFETRHQLDRGEFTLYHILLAA